MNKYLSHTELVILPERSPQRRKSKERRLTREKGIGNMTSVLSGSSKEGTRLTKTKREGNWERELGEDDGKQHMGDQKRNLWSCRSKARLQRKVLSS